MTRDEIIRRNDELRTTLKGGVVLFTPAVWERDARLRGRTIYRISLCNTFAPDSDHSEGVFIFAGYTFVWKIEEFAGERTITLMLACDL